MVWNVLHSYVVRNFSKTKLLQILQEKLPCENKIMNTVPTIYKLQSLILMKIFMKIKIFRPYAYGTYIIAVIKLQQQHTHTHTHIYVCIKIMS